jgi:hypothetical protein
MCLAVGDIDPVGNSTDSLYNLLAVLVPGHGPGLAVGADCHLAGDGTPVPDLERELGSLRLRFFWYGHCASAPDALTPVERRTACVS